EMRRLAHLITPSSQNSPIAVGSTLSFSFRLINPSIFLIDLLKTPIVLVQFHDAFLGQVDDRCDIGFVRRFNHLMDVTGWDTHCTRDTSSGSHALYSHRVRSACGKNFHLVLYSVLLGRIAHEVDHAVV